jgi:hypothetical protein
VRQRKRERVSGGEEKEKEGEAKEEVRLFGAGACLVCAPYREHCWLQS